MATSDRNKGNGTTRVALVGAGYIASYHLEALRHIPGALLVGVCDLNESRARGLAAQAGSQVAAFTDLAQLVHQARPDVAHVLTPPQAHVGPTHALLEAGVAVLVEKPLATTAAECAQLAALAERQGVALGTSHNFLFAAPYERLMKDLAAGHLGRLDQIDIVWNKPLPQVQFGPFGGWLFRDPRNILFEVAPHSFAHVAHLLGPLDDLKAEARDPVALPGGGIFYRHWELQGQRGPTAVRLRFSFIDGFAEHYIHVRGSTASATVNFELDTYVLDAPSRDLLDFDRFAMVVRGASGSIAQAVRTVGTFVLSKAGLPFEGGPYSRSITGAIRAFYAGRNVAALDSRLGAALAKESIVMAEAAAKTVKLAPAPAVATPAKQTKSSSKPSILVLGGTGFIGRALVKRLRKEGLGVRALVRDTGGFAAQLADLGAELVKGDIGDIRSVEAALEGITDVYHLARGNGRIYDDYVRQDIEPTRLLAEACIARGIRLMYTSSIVIYNGGETGDVISEQTPACEGAVRVNAYARAKIESEQMLLELRRTRGLKVVLFRPGIVIGDGGSPFHWGVGAWPHKSICHVWGRGDSPLPFVLVDDCADALALARTAENTDGESFNLVGEPCLSGHQYLDEFERAGGIKIKRVPIAPWLLFTMDIGKWGLKTVAKTPGRSRPSLDYYKGRGCHGLFSPEKAKQTLNWKPTADRSVLVRDGIALPVTQFLG